MPTVAFKPNVNAVLPTYSDDNIASNEYCAYDIVSRASLVAVAWIPAL